MGVQSGREGKGREREGWARISTPDLEGAYGVTRHLTHCLAAAAAAAAAGCWLLDVGAPSSPGSSCQNWSSTCRLVEGVCTE